MPMEHVPILMADDDEDDRMLTEDALKESRLSNPLYFVKDGQELLDYLRHEGDYQDPKLAPRPGLILLDLNMPRMDGKTALNHIKSDPNLKSIPVVVLTTSNQDVEVMQSYESGANSYIVKPVKFENLVQCLRVMGEYWFSVVKLTKGG